MEILDRIARDPAVMGGRPCVKGTRVTVGALVGLIASGTPQSEVREAYPYLESADIAQALTYAAWRAQEIEIVHTA